MNKNVFAIPHEGVEALESGAYGNHVAQDFGFVYIEIDKVVYSRDYNEQMGLIRMQTGVDFMIKRKWFDKYIEFKMDNNDNS